MKVARPSSHFFVWIGAGIFLVLILTVQIYLSLREEHPSALADEFTERSRDFVEQTKQSLEANKQQ